MAEVSELATVELAEADAPNEHEHGGELGLRPGAMIGRYVVLDYIGQGAYGEVHSAFDPQLDRRVAIKLLRRQSDGGARALAHEAQVMAKLSHANVVAVHDVGTVTLAGRVEPQLFVAMQYVPGGTLRDWWTAQPRSWGQVVEMLIQAGRGLAAAHAAGLVHRDFKPDNVLVGEDGRARVTDFGLARTLEHLRASEASSSSGERELAAAGILPVSRWRGTPAYMAPEQFRGGAVDHLTDQFCFCICLFEALFGARPFAGATAMDIARSVCAGDMIAPLEDVAVPRRILDAVRRGLAVERERRFADMYALLDALDPPPGRRWPVVALATAAIGGALAMVSNQRPAPADPCAEAGVEMVRLWSPERRTKLDRAIRQTAVPGAGETAGLVLAELDRYAEQWQEARARSCLEQAAAVEIREFDLLRARCLERRFDAFAAQVEALGEIEAGQVGRLVATVSALSPVSGCDDLGELARYDALAPSESAELRGFERQLERVYAMIDTGAYGRALSRLEPIAAPIEELGDPGLIAEFELLRGQIAVEQHQADKAEPALRRAFFVGLRSGHDAIAVRASGLLAQLVSTDLDRPDEARDWVEHGQALAARIGDVELLARAENSAGIAAYRAGEFERALEHFRRSRGHYIEAYGPEHVRVGRAEINIAAILLSLHRYAEALPHHATAARIIEARLGTDHVDNATVHLNYGLTLTNLGRHDEARRELEAALAVLDRRGEPGDEFTRALIHNGFGELDSRAGDWTAAAAQFDRMHELLRGVVGERSSYTANAMVAASAARVRLGRVDEALPQLERGAALLDELGAPAEELANARAELAIGLISAGLEPERAQALLQLALDHYAANEIELPPPISAWLDEHPELRAPSSSG